MTTASYARPVATFVRVLDQTEKLFSIRFHFKNGQSRDMHVNEGNDLLGAKKVMGTINKILGEFGNYAVKSDTEVSQNFIVMDDDLSFIEIVER